MLRYNITAFWTIDAMGYMITPHVVVIIPGWVAFRLCGLVIVIILITIIIIAITIIITIIIIIIIIIII